MRARVQAAGRRGLVLLSCGVYGNVVRFLMALTISDAVFAEGNVRSGLWEAVGPARAVAKGIDPRALPAHYRERNLLKAEITGSHVGKAVAFLASGQIPTTGAVLPVDGGLPEAFLR